MIGSNQVSNVASSVVTPVALSGFKTPLLNEFEGASAAYSLRRLKSWEDGSKVVRVRRATDNEEKDFSSVDVANGTMANWVNAYTDLPLDVDSGATAAYSLRNLKASYTGNVVEVRRTSDDAVQSFTAAEVADGTLEDWVNGYTDKLNLQTETGSLVGNVSNETSTGFDFSVNNEGSTGFKNLLDSSDVTAGSYEITFDVNLNSGSLAGVTVVISDTINYQSQSLVSGSNSFSGTVSNTAGIFFRTSGTVVADVSITNITLTKTDVDKLDLQPETGGLTGNVSNETATGFDFSVNNEGSTGFKNLLASGQVTAGTYIATFDVVLNSGSLAGIVFRSGSPFVDTDLVVGSNSITVNPDGTKGIFFRTSGTAVADVSITNITLTQTTADGHVKTWYDQSGNTNHATQTDTAKQPKIVEGGVLVTRNGDAAIKSTSNNEMTFTLGSLSADGQQSVFSVLENDVTSQDGFGEVFKVNSNSTGTGGVNRRPYWFVNPTGGLVFTVASASGYQNTDREYRLYSHVMNDAAGGTSTIHQDGTQVDTRSITLDANATFSEGKVLGVTTNATGALYMSEVIYYDSDQTDNRTAIEANIGDYYSIDLPAGVDSGNNEVDGFVTKWYDQSGNGNDAVQTTAAKQPKIVDGGTLIKRNNNPAVESTSDDSLSFTLDSLSADGQQSVFAVLENDVTAQDGFGEVFKVNSNSTGTGGVNRRPYWFVNPTGGLAFAVASASGYQNTDREYRLYSHVMNDAAGGTSTIHQDGTQVDTRSITLDANATFSEGKVLGVTTNATGSLYMSEVIYYPSDQTANRPAIETNINAHYNIY